MLLASIQSSAQYLKDSAETCKATEEEINGLHQSLVKRNEMGIRDQVGDSERQRTYKRARRIVKATLQEVGRITQLLGIGQSDQQALTKVRQDLELSQEFAQTARDAVRVEYLLRSKPNPEQPAEMDANDYFMDPRATEKGRQLMQRRTDLSGTLSRCRVDHEVALVSQPLTQKDILRTGRDVWIICHEYSWAKHAVQVECGMLLAQIDRERTEARRQLMTAERRVREEQRFSRANSTGMPPVEAEIPTSGEYKAAGSGREKNLGGAWIVALRVQEAPPDA